MRLYYFLAMVKESGTQASRWAQAVIVENFLGKFILIILLQRIQETDTNVHFDQPVSSYHSMVMVKVSRLMILTKPS